MPEVSIVIAAYRPRFLDVAIASALAQTFHDFELLISDDSTGDEVEAVVAKWTDGRIRYTRNPRRQVPGANRDHLLALASGRYVKFLWDDDLLLPQSLEVLVATAKAHRAQLAFHHRYFVDSNGRPEPSFAPVAAGQVSDFTSDDLFRLLVSRNAQFQNVIGEPSNLMVETACLRSLPNPFAFGSRRVRFLDDIALFLNLAAAGCRTVGVGIPLSAFRHHDEQMSDAHSQVSSSGLYEWELVNRWSADNGHVEPEDCVAMLQRLRLAYTRRIDEFPELAAFMALDVDPGPDGRFLTAELDAALAAASRVIDLRRRRQLNGGYVDAPSRHVAPRTSAPSPPAPTQQATMSSTTSISPGPIDARPDAPGRHGTPGPHDGARGPLVTVALPVRDQALPLASCLVALSRTLPPSLDFEVVVVDCGSTDATADVLASVSGDIRVERHQRSVDLGEALDRSLHSSCGSYVCLLDVTCAPQGEWIQPLIEALDQVPTLAAVLPLGPDGDTPSTDLVLIRSSALSGIGGLAAFGQPTAERIVAALKAANLQVAAVAPASQPEPATPQGGRHSTGAPILDLSARARAARSA